MGENSKIEWTEATWNPIRGCVKVSPGCKHCYAESFAERFRGVPGHPYRFGFDLRIVPEKLLEPFRWTKPRVVFVNSMSDLFQENVPEEFVQAVIAVMLAANWHTYQVLTKRADKMRDLLSGSLCSAAGAEHIWWGVSVEDKRYGLPRIEQLKSTPASVRFLSIEPLLEDLGVLNLSGIHWVIVGGESGHGARPIDEQWIISIRDQCVKSKVPFFFKQWGGVQKVRRGRELGGRTYDAIPLRKSGPMPAATVRREMAAKFERSARAWQAHPLAYRR